MTERGKQSPLQYLGERFFGHGRRFGMQRGSLEQRLKDPFTKSSSVVRDYWLNRRRGPNLEEFTDGARLLQEQINAGIADDQLIPVLDVFLSRGGPMKERTFSISLIDPLLGLPNTKRTLPSNRYSLYSSLISGANSVESTPYLLQALQSSFVVIADEPYESSAPVLLGQGSEERIEDTTEGHLGWYQENWTTVRINVVYDIWGQRNKYHARKPYAEMAKLRLQEIARTIVGGTNSGYITEAIDRFEATKPPFIEIEESRRVEVSHTAV